MNEESRNIAKKYLSDEMYKKLIEEQRKKDHYLTDAIKEEQRKLFKKNKPSTSVTLYDYRKENQAKDIVILNKNGDVIRTVHSIHDFMLEYGKSARIDLSNAKPYKARLYGGIFAQFKYYYDSGETGVYGEIGKKWVKREITPILQVDGKGNIIHEFDSLNDAMRAFRCGNKVILNRPYITFYPRRGIYLQCKDDHLKGYRFK